MGLHGIVMESMKMTHVYATKIHDIFWDRMRLTAYIYGCISIVEHNQNHEQHQWTLQWTYHQNKISCFSLGQYHWKYIYVIYSKSHDLNCGDHLFYPPFPHAFPTGSMVRRWCPTPASRVAPSPRRWSAKRHDRRRRVDLSMGFCMFTRDTLW